MNQLMDINQLVVMFLVVMSSSFFGVGLWIYLAVDKYVKFVQLIRQEEKHAQQIKREEYTRLIQEYMNKTKGRVGTEYDSFDDPDKGGFVV